MMVKQDTKFLRTLYTYSAQVSGYLFSGQRKHSSVAQKTGAQKKQVHISKKKKNYNKLLHFVTSPAQHHKVSP